MAQVRDSAGLTHVIRPAARSSRWSMGDTSRLAPVAAVAVLALVLAHDVGQIAWGELARFTAYVALGLTVPGTIAWRWLTRRRPGPLAADAAIGTILGYVLEVPVYLVARDVGIPRLALAWPAAMLVLAIATRHGGRLWLGTPRRRMPLGSLTGLSALLGVVTLLSARSWVVAPASGLALRNPYVDEPFQLALTGEQIQHGLAQYPFVAGTPLEYHWFTYAHLASAHWATGIEPATVRWPHGDYVVLALTPLTPSVIAQTTVLHNHQL